MMPSSNATPSLRTGGERRPDAQHGRRRDREDDRLEERQTDRTRITTRETLTSKSGRAEQRRGPAAQQAERPKQSEANKAYSGNPRPQANKPEAPQLPWDPEVTLIPCTNAPLASRISMPPLASHTPLSLQPKPLRELSLAAQETAIIEDLLYVFMGYEAQNIWFAKTYDPSVEKDRLSGPSYRILPGLDPSLRDLTTAMLKMATHYKAVEAFVEARCKEEFGAVNHALCAAIRKLLHDYLVLIAQLETQFFTNSSFTLQVLNMHTLPTSHMIFQLYSLAHDILRQEGSLPEEDGDLYGNFNDIEDVLEALREGPSKNICKGGSVLGLITKRLELSSGDPAMRSLLTSLLRDTSRPYMKILNEWVHRGSLKDPYAEFMVRELKSIRRERLEEDYTDDYWDRRYTIRDNIPPQLEGVKDKILLAGKYLNVIRECGSVDIRAIEDVPQSFEDPRMLDNVNNAYAYANESLLQLLLTTYTLPTRLRSLKHYFFLDRSDFFSHFLELGTSELRKPVEKVNISKLQSLLDLVIHQPGSLATQDPFKEDIKVEMNRISLINSLTRVVNISGMEQGEIHRTPSPPATETEKGAIGFTSLQLDCSIPFPVSLVISRKTIWRYQVLFRYLLSLRHLEQQLVASWQVPNRAVTWSHHSSDQELQIWKRRVFTLRARMIVFVQQLLYFCTSEVIEPNWQILMEKISAREDGAGCSKPTISTVDELMKYHVDFLDTCLKGCMLTNSKLLKIHSKLMYTCTIFTTWTSWFSQELVINDPDLASTQRPANMNVQEWAQVQSDKNRYRSRTLPGSAGETQEARFGKMQDILGKCEANFGKHVQILLDGLNHYAATETVVLLGLCAKLSTVIEGTEYAGLKTGGQAQE